MALDDLDRALLQALIGDGASSARKLAETVGSTAPTVTARLKRLQDLGVYRGVTADVALPQFGHLVIAVGPANRVADLAAIDEVFNVYRSAGNRAYAMALFGSEHALEEFRRRFPDVETHILLREEHAGRPTLPEAGGAVTCHECGKRIMDDPITFRVEGRAYAVCCATCESQLRERHTRLAAGR